MTPDPIRARLDDMEDLATIVDGRPGMAIRSCLHALNAVLVMHAPFTLTTDALYCKACSIDYPCGTYQAIAEALEATP